MSTLDKAPPLPIEEKKTQWKFPFFPRVFSSLDHIFPVSCTIAAKRGSSLVLFPLSGRWGCATVEKSHVTPPESANPFIGRKTSIARHKKRVETRGIRGKKWKNRIFRAQVPVRNAGPLVSAHFDVDTARRNLFIYKMNCSSCAALLWRNLSECWTSQASVLDETAL